MSKIWPRVEPAVLRSLESRMENQSTLSVDFLVLLASATFIATFGLLQNSPAVIIGAMIIAPLMRPILGLSLATITADVKLLVRALISILVGTVVAVSIAAVLARIFYTLEFTDEVLGRTHPTILDLGVAIAAGAVGAYCHSDERLADTLAGVAIAVALVPPLSVVGIGLAHETYEVWSGSLLLFATNLIGISFAGSLVFLLKGFTPLSRAKRGLTISLIMSLILLLPLGLSMRELIIENQISSQVKLVLKEKTFTFKDMQLEKVTVKNSEGGLVAFVTVTSADQKITGNQVGLVENFLSKEIGTPIDLHLRLIEARDITSKSSPKYSQPDPDSTGPASAPLRSEESGESKPPAEAVSAPALPEEEPAETTD